LPVKIGYMSYPDVVVTERRTRAALRRAESCRGRASDPSSVTLSSKTVCARPNEAISGFRIDAEFPAELCRIVSRGSQRRVGL
jgi:hypothetical protein